MSYSAPLLSFDFCRLQFVGPLFWSCLGLGQHDLDNISGYSRIQNYMPIKSRPI